MTVSVPEKTLEHWVSQYILYRFRSNAIVWWPAVGEDIDIRQLPRQPGKAVALEVKTASVLSGGGHEIRVDIGQLWSYAQKPVFDQPVYTFPLPRWEGVLSELGAATWRGQQNPSELAFSRSGFGVWFADWMVVMTTREVATVMATALAGHPNATLGTARRLLTIPPGGGRITWSDPATAATTRPLRSFWDQLADCGRPGWPQTLLVERNSLPSERPISHASAAASLRASLHARENGESRFGSDPQRADLVCLVQADSDVYEVRELDDPTPRRSVDENSDYHDSRVAAFIAGQALGMEG